MPDPWKQRCTGKSKQSGQQCKRWAVPGHHVCVIHGGKIPAVQAAAKRNLERTEALNQAERYAQPEDIEPIDGLIRSLRIAAGMVSYWQQEVETLAESKSLIQRSVSQVYGTTEYTVEAAHQHHRWTTNLATFSKLCLAAGIAERTLKLKAQEAQLVASFVKGFCTDMGLNVNDPQVVRAYTRNLELVASTPVEVA